MTDDLSPAEARSQIEHYCDNMVSESSLLGESFALIWSEYDRLAAEVAALREKVQRVEAVCDVWASPPWRDNQQQIVRTGHAGQIRSALAGNDEALRSRAALNGTP
jgi:hypothetical protein